MKNQIAYRQARNSMLDIIGLGTSIPVRDIKAFALKEKVAFNKEGKIRLENCEKGVSYQPFVVYWENDQLIYQAFGKQINCSQEDLDITLTTYPIKYDSWFAVRAYKSVESANLELFLHDFLPIQVGIDTSLKYSFKTEPVIDYSSTISVVVEKAQEGVVYELLDVDGRVVSQQAITGADADITLSTVPLLENTTIKVRATKIIYKYELENTDAATAGSEAEIDRTETDFLKVEVDGEEVLNLKTVYVRPNLALNVETTVPIIDFEGAAKVKISNVQKSVSYALAVRAMDYPDYELLGNRPENTASYTSFVTTAEGDVFPFVGIKRETAYNANSYKQLGEFVFGQDTDLELEIPNLDEDVYVIVYARKPEIDDLFSLHGHSSVLVRPDSAPTVEAQDNPVDYNAETNIIVRKTQNDIGYQLLRYAEKTEPIGDPAYHFANRGVDFMRTDFDFMIGDEPDEYLVPDKQTILYQVILPTYIVTEHAKYGVRAEKRRTGLRKVLQGEVDLRYRLQILTDLNVTLLAKGNVFDYGTELTFSVDNTQEQVSYRLVNQDGDILSREVAGTGNTIMMKSAVLKEDLVVRVQANKKVDLNNDETDVLLLDRSHQILIRLNKDLKPTIESNIIDYQAVAVAKLAGAQASVVYQLMARGISGAEYLATAPQEQGTFSINSKGTGEKDVVWLQEPQFSADTFVVSGDVVRGNDATATISSAGLAEDAYLFIKATKETTKETYYYPTCLPVLVKPDRSVVAQLKEQNIEKGTEANVLIYEGQAGVKYQLILDSATVGEAGYHPEERSVDSMRSDIDFVVEVVEQDYIDLPTGILNEDTTFGVRAIKIASGIYVALDSRPEIQIAIPREATEMQSGETAAETTASNVEIPQPTDDSEKTTDATNTTEQTNNGETPQAPDSNSPNEPTV